MLDTSEKRAIVWVWIGIALVSLSDPLWFTFISSIVTILTPPMLWSTTLPALGALQDRVTSGPPGLRMCIFITLGLALTLAVLVNHSARETKMWELTP
jgi:hypothetical protein